MARTVNPLKWPGGKTPLARRIVALMPSHERFYEPFCGGAAVALEHARRHPCIPRTLGDLNAALVEFWKVLVGPSGAKLAGRVPARLPKWEEFEAAGDVLAGVVPAGSLDRAAAFFVRNRGSRAADMRTYFKPTCRQRRGMDEQLSAWLSGRDSLTPTHHLLGWTLVERVDAFDTLARHRDDPDALFYLDPPYLHATRGGSDYYIHEMTEAGHARLLALLGAATCRVILSGYRSEMYDDGLTGWHRLEIRRRNSMAGGKAKRARVECLWTNFAPPSGHRAEVLDEAPDTPVE